MYEHDTEIMEEAAKAVYFETGQRLGMPDDALQYNDTAVWFSNGNLYAMNSLEAYVRFYTHPEIVAWCMVGNTPEGGIPAILSRDPRKRH